MFADDVAIAHLLNEKASRALSMQRITGLHASTYIGREDELIQAKARLFCAVKRNILLTGPPGVGKTSFVHKLAAELTKSSFRKASRTIILEGSIGHLVAGTRFRGDFEQRIIELIDAVSPFENVVLFFDEAHTMCATGGEAGIPLTDLLKPHLLNGDLRVILATTDNEAARLERDGAFARRFEKIQLRTLSETERAAALAAHFRSLHDFHGLISGESLNELLNVALDATIDLHAVIDQLDFAMAKLTIEDKNHA